jgi:hypothetical protein
MPFLTLCETRWGSRSYSLFTFLSAFSVVCSSFVELEHGGDEQARSYVCPITKFDCIVCPQTSIPTGDILLYQAIFIQVGVLARFPCFVLFVLKIDDFIVPKDLGFEN